MSFAIAGRVASRAARSSVARAAVAAPLLPRTLPSSLPRTLPSSLPRTLPFSTGSRLPPSLPHVATKHGNVGNDFLNEIKQGFAHQEQISEKHAKLVIASVKDVIESRFGRRGPGFFKIIFANVVTMAGIIAVGTWVFFEKCNEVDAVLTKLLERYGAIFGSSAAMFWKWLAMWKEYEAEKKRQEEEEAQKKERRDDEKKKRAKEVQRIVFFVSRAIQYVCRPFVK